MIRTRPPLALAALLLTGVVISFDARGQGITEFPVPAGHYPKEITAGPDGNLWFTGEPNLIGRMTIQGSVTEFPIPTPNSGPTGIAPGLDGNLWFLEASANQVGRITPDGVIVEFSVPTSRSGLASIATGSDGSLWFTESAVNKIGRITTGGEVTEFPLPQSESLPSPIGITATQDGSFWFAEADKKIGRITTTGLVKEFVRPTFGHVCCITARPDGNIWYTSYDGYGDMGSNLFDSKIVQMTSDGQFREFLLPSPNSGPGSITTGSDGNLWFIERGRIGRIMPNGVITEYSVPTLFPLLFDIAPGPDGNVWYTDRTGKIGRITTSEPRPRQPRTIKFRPSN